MLYIEISILFYMNTVIINGRDTSSNLASVPMKQEEDKESEEPTAVSTDPDIQQLSNCMANLKISGLPNGSSGIINPGNTCYMNSAIQTISHTYFLRHYLLTEEENIKSILLLNAKKNLSDIKIFYSADIINKLKEKINDPSYDVNMLNPDEVALILNSTMTYQILRVLKGLWSKNCTVNPTSFRRIFSEVRDKFFYGDNQHDAEEAYSCIIQKMQEELGMKADITFRSHNKQVGKLMQAKNNIAAAQTLEEKRMLSTKYLELKAKMPVESLILESYKEMKKHYDQSYSKISEIFAGFFHSSIKCPDVNCGYAFNKFTAYFHISLAMPARTTTTNPFANLGVLGYASTSTSTAVTLDDCMEAFSAEEILDANNLWKCDKCKNLVPAHKQEFLWTNPVVLVIQLKRFGYDRRHKDNRLVTYPVKNLDIAPIISPINKDIKNKCYQYDLYSVINHIGGIGGGHYYSYCLDEETNRWFKYNDSNPVTEVKSDAIVNNHAYILFYIRKDMFR